MYWKINFIILFLYSVQSFGYSLPNVQAKASLPAVNVSYQNGNNNIVLDVLKKVYAGLTGEAAGRNNIPNTYGLSLHGHQGFMWNMLNNASRHFKVGAKGGGFLKNAKTNSKQPHIQKGHNIHLNSEPKNESDNSVRARCQNKKCIQAKQHSPQNLSLNVSAELNFNQPPHNIDENKLNKEKKENDEQDDIQAEIEAEDDQSLFLQLINQLLDDEQFWNWLADWTEAYTNLLDDHIKISVTTEVTKQIKEFFDKFDYFFDLSNHKAEEKVEEKDDNKCNGYTRSRRSDSPEYDSEIDRKYDRLKGFINTQYIRNSSVHNEYITNLYITGYSNYKKIKDEEVQGDYWIHVRTGAEAKDKENAEENFTPESKINKYID